MKLTYKIIINEVSCQKKKKKTHLSAIYVYVRKLREILKLFSKPLKGNYNMMFLHQEKWEHNPYSFVMLENFTNINTYVIFLIIIPNI